jgi:carboxypeptidase PM20D1
MLTLEKVNYLSLVYRWRGQQQQLKPLLLLAHQDVVLVEANSFRRWQQPPFAGIIKDGVIWGRGAVNDKMV